MASVNIILLFVIGFMAVAMAEPNPDPLIVSPAYYGYKSPYVGYPAGLAYKSYYGYGASPYSGVYGRYFY